MTDQQTPIADLSYRNYDGPKSVSATRWLPIMKSGLKVNLKKKALWVLVVLAAMPYFLVILTMLFAAEASQAAGVSDLVRFPDLLVTMYGSAQFWLFLTALLIGASAIAADNRAQALQVYLSKPITKADYLIGKWLAVFIIIFGVAFVPIFMATFYAAFSLGIGSFLGQNPLLFPKLLALAFFPAALHTSLLLGISAWNKTPWLAGVIYAGFWIFTTILSIVLSEDMLPASASPEVVATIESLNLGGIISGLGASVMGTAGGNMGLLADRVTQPVPMWQPLALALVLLCALGLALAAVRIRAVDVVQS